MASGMGECCLSGKLQSGSPTGHEDRLGGLDVYISEPEGGSKAKTVIFLTDIFGWKFPNTRLLADTYAKAGFYVYVPDVLDGSAIDESFLQDVEPPRSVRDNLSVTEKATKTAKVGATLGPFLVKNREAVAKPRIDNFIDEVKKLPGTGKVGAIGFCWVGRYAILCAHGADAGNVNAAYACHPSLLAVPGDIDPVTRPLSIAFGDQDSLVPNDQVAQIKEILDKKQATVQSEVKVYEDQVHGFTLRGDFDSDKDKKAMDDACQQGVDWFNRYLS